MAKSFIDVVQDRPFAQYLLSHTRACSAEPGRRAS